MAVVFSSIWDFLGPFVAGVPVQGRNRPGSVRNPGGQGRSGRPVRPMERPDVTRPFHLIATDLEQKGIQIGVDVTSSMINAAIEVAVQKVKTAPPAPE